MAIVKPKKEKEVEALPLKKARYYEGLGSRKTALARVRLYTTKGDVIVNGKTCSEYFKMPKLQNTAISSLATMNVADTMSASIRVSGGGISAQADAIRHGLARALVAFNEDFRKRLRSAGFLTRDARAVERKKPGLKKARKSPQWAKR